MASLREFQNLMARIYLAKDSKRGPEGTYKWLKEEVDELGEAMREDDKEALEDEFADVIAWLASLANVLEVDLENVAFKKYNNCCPKCRSIPCQCQCKP